MKKQLIFSLLIITFHANFMYSSQHQLSLIETIIPTEIIKPVILPRLKLKDLANFSRTSKKMDHNYNPTTLALSQEISDQMIIARHFRKFHKASRGIMNCYEKYPKIAQLIWDHQPEEKRKTRINILKSLYGGIFGYDQITSEKALRMHKPMPLDQYASKARNHCSNMTTDKDKKYMQSFITAAVIATIKNSITTEDDYLIFTACEIGDYHLTKYLIKNSVTTEDDTGDTLLHVASYNGYIDKTFDPKNYIKVIKFLIKEGIDINAKNIEGLTAYNVCSRKGKNAINNRIYKNIDAQWEKLATITKLLIDNGATKSYEPTHRMRPTPSKRENLEFKKFYEPVHVLKSSKLEIKEFATPSRKELESHNKILETLIKNILESCDEEAGQYYNQEK